jgi:protoheme IX farnesyltransferase
VTRFQRLAAATFATALVLVTIGVAVRATDSGLACPHWPGCFEGRFWPGLDADYHVWLEWIHRTVAALIGALIIGLAALAWIDQRDRRSILWPALAAVGLVGYQGWLGRETVRLGNSGGSVLAHLTAAMLLVGLLVYLLVRSRHPARLPVRSAWHGFTLGAAFNAAVVFALLLFGASVTAAGAGLVFLDWPLMDGGLGLPASGTPADLADLRGIHVLHRVVAAAAFVVLVALAVAASRNAALPRRLVRLAWLLVAADALQVVVGGLQVLTLLDEWTQVAHVALAASVWAGAAWLAIDAHYSGRVAAGLGSPAGGGEPGGVGEPGGLEGGDPASAGRRETIAAYVALMKPRVIELLLVTTVPAMVLATRDRPGVEPLDWLVLTAVTLVCGTLAAGSANAFNQVLERDIDERMARTRRRPLPAQRLGAAAATRFGVVLAVVSVTAMAVLVNLLAAFLTLLAIGFYVVVYTVLLKRSTPQNIVIGGAAGALPPVIGWAAVTGDIGLPAVMLFLVVFYWTPPHFWALALRIRDDYAAAGIPMLPVVRGVAETSRQIGLYTILLVAISLVFAAVARMGLLYFGAAIVLGATFLWQAFRLWREGDSPAASTARAISLYRFSNGYLALLFAAVAADVLLPLAV